MTRDSPQAAAVAAGRGDGMTAPLCSIVTAAWGRPRTIMERAIPSVEAQDYEAIEHVIVTDGRDAGLNRVLAGAGYAEGGFRRRLVCLGRNWSHPDVVRGGVGVIPRQVGAWMAAGEFIAYLDDDNEYLPDHVSSLVSVLQETGVDFACSRWHDGPGGPVGGWQPPGRGRTDTSSIMHRASILRHGTWDPSIGYENDGALVERWIAAGCSWAVLTKPTFVLHPHRRGAPDPEPEPAGWAGARP